MTKIQVAINAAVAAGKLLENHYGMVKEVKSKESLRDVVSNVDKIAEETAISIIKDNFKDSTIISEEGDQSLQNSKEIWVVDALDGTVNYIHQFPYYCVSISYWVNDKPKLGVVYNPNSSELFYAEKHLGAFLNQKRLKIRDCAINEGLTAMAFSGKAYNPDERYKEFDIFGKVNDLSRGCLRTGSAALNLCYLADGRFSLVIGKANKMWDIGAGLIIAEEAAANVNFRIVDKENFLIDYLAAVPASKRLIESKLDLSFIKYN